MAEINVVRNERSLWPWLVAAVVAAALIWYFVGRNTDTTPRTASRTDSTMMQNNSMRDSGMRATAPLDTSSRMMAPSQAVPRDSQRPPR